MTLWPCFICGSTYECEHREVELLVWLREMDLHGLPARPQPLQRIDPAAARVSAPHVSTARKAG